jgi:hypothetical protein
MSYLFGYQQEAQVWVTGVIMLRKPLPGFKISRETLFSSEAAERFHCNPPVMNQRGADELLSSQFTLGGEGGWRQGRLDVRPAPKPTPR